MEDETVLVLVGVAVAGIAAYSLWKKMDAPWSTATGIQAVESAGMTTWTGTYNPGSTMVNAKDGLFSGTNTTYKFNEGDFEKLNFAQKTLITIDKIIPGTFLSRWALT